MTKNLPDVEDQMPIKTPPFGSKIGMTAISSLWSRAMSYSYTYLGCTRYMDDFGFFA